MDIRYLQMLLASERHRERTHCSFPFCRRRIRSNHGWIFYMSVLYRHLTRIPLPSDGGHHLIGRLAHHAHSDVETDELVRGCVLTDSRFWGLCRIMVGHSQG